MKKYGIMELLELAVNRFGRWTRNREIIWSGLNTHGTDWICEKVPFLHTQNLTHFLNFEVS